MAFLKLKREHTIALTVLGGIALLAFGVNFLKGLDLLQRPNLYYAVYGNVQGLAKASPLLLNGFKIGQVQDAELLFDGTGRIVITYQVNTDDLKIPKDSKVEIGGDLFNTWAQLRPGTSAEFAQPGDTITGFTKPSLTESFNSTIDPLKQKAEGMVASVDSVLTALQSILNKNSVGDINASFASIRATLETLNGSAHKLDDMLAEESGTIKATLDNCNRVSKTLADNNARLTNIFSNLDSLTAALNNGQLQKTLADVSAASGELKGMMADINSGKGTLGALVKDDSLYHNLNNASAQLDLLLEDLRVNPNRYFSVFGKKDKLPKLSDADIERIREAMKAKGQ